MAKGGEVLGRGAGLWGRAWGRASVSGALGESRIRSRTVVLKIPVFRNNHGTRQNGLIASFCTGPSDPPLCSICVFLREAPGERAIRTFWAVIRARWATRTGRRTASAAPAHALGQGRLSYLSKWSKGESRPARIKVRPVPGPSRARPQSLRYDVRIRTRTLNVDGFAFIEIAVRRRLRYHHQHAAI